MENKSKTFNFIYPAGISAVVEFGMDKWSDNFFMPVPRNTYFDIYDELSRAYGKTLTRMNPSAEPYWSWVTNYKITYQITEYLYRLLFLQKLRECGFKSIAISSEMKICDAEKKLPELLTFPLISAKPRITRLLLEKWRAVRTNWGGCSISSYLLPSVFNSKLYILGGRGGGEVGAYLKDLGMDPVNLRPDLYIRKDISGNFISDSEKACEIFKNEMTAVLEKYGIALPKGYYQGLARYISDCSMLISGTRPNICRWAQSELIINPVANLKHRIFASAWRLSGGSVTGIVHGIPYVYGNIHPDIVNGSNSMLTKFVTMSSAEKKLFEWSKENRSTGLQSQAEIHACKNTIYKERFEVFNSGDIPKTIKNIMLMGTPLNDDLPLSDRLYYLLIEIELLSFLIKNDYHVTYKAHPDTLKATEQLFAETGCKRVTDKFEDVWDTCDCVLFPHVFTTAFGLSLMTPKHVIAFSWKDNSFWRPESLEKLKKRAMILDIDIDGEGKPFFDKKMLLDSLASPKGFNHSLIDEFALM